LDLDKEEKGDKSKGEMREKPACSFSRQHPTKLFADWERRREIEMGGWILAKRIGFERACRCNRV
jgi:hypothetical protein